MLRQQSISLGRILGIPIGLDYSWFLIFGLLTWTLAVGYYPAEFKNWPAAEYWVVGAITAIMLFVSVLLHELGHSVVAMRYKIPVRSITLFVFGGVAQIAAEPPSATAEFLIAIAGPIVSFALAAIFSLLQPIFASVAPLLALAKYLAYINGTLALFNLIPGFPLDGGRVFRAAVWGTTGSLRRATVIAGNIGRLIGYLFIFFGVWQVLGGNFTNGLWIAFIGWFLESAAVAQVQQQRLQELLAGHKVSQAMSRNYVAVHAGTTLQQMVDEHILGSGRRSFVVQEDGKALGLLTLHHLKGIPRDQWPTITAAQAMIPLDQLKRARPDMELWAAIEEMDRDGVNQLPVMADGQIQGMLTREDVISYLRTLQELGM
ncbi:MAG: site-2 protease family protein [Anaerolineae bacterium]